MSDLQPDRCRECNRCLTKIDSSDEICDDCAGLNKRVEVGAQAYSEGQGDSK